METVKKEKVRTAIYPRVSREEQQETGYSFEAQQDKFSAICEASGREIVKVYKGEGDAKDDRSASIKDDSIDISIEGDKFIVSFDLSKRPNFKQMLLDAPKGMYDEIMFFKWDRFSRDFAFQKLALIYLQRHGITMHPTDDTQDPTAREIMSVINEKEPKKTGERVKLALSSKFKKGVMVCSKMPLGYRWNPEKKLPEIDPESSVVVKNIFNDLASGDNIESVSEKYNIGKQSLISIVRNRVYIGFISYEGKEKRGIHEPLVSQDVFDKANAQ